MKTLIGIIIISVICLTAAQCDRCIGTGLGDCADLFSFRIVDKVTHEDLVFGQNHIYNSDSVYLFSNSYPGHLSHADSSNFTSMLETPVDTFYLYLNSADIDTLLMSYDYKNAPCCAKRKGYGKIREIKFDGVVAENQGDIFLLAK